MDEDRSPTPSSESKTETAQLHTKIKSDLARLGWVQTSVLRTRLVLLLLSLILYIAVGDTPGQHVCCMRCCQLIFSRPAESCPANR